MLNLNSAALKTHPDRVPADSPERATRTRKFQQVNDAYYTLSDPTRRRDYDSARTFHNVGSDDTSNDASAGTFPWSSFGFGAKTEAEEERYSNDQFSGAFEEMLREEGMADNQARPTGSFWSILGGAITLRFGFSLSLGSSRHREDEDRG
jgi:diphthamide biosynthesis protein 4